MPDQAPVFARDYTKSAVQARYGYYASVLRPGMTKTEFRNAIVSIQNTTGSFWDGGTFVTKLNDDEIDEFYNRYEIARR